MASATLVDLKILSKKISKKLKIGDSVYLKGNLGTGKTTFARFCIHELLKKNKKKLVEVISPTFTIAQYYPLYKKNFIAHYDLYRITKLKDLDNIGILETNNQSISFVEWPEILKRKNKNRIEITLKHTKDENQRFLNVKYFGRIKK